MLPLPLRETLTGGFFRVEPLDIAKHAEDVLASCSTEITDADWNYLPYGPFREIADFETGLATQPRGLASHVSDDGGRLWNALPAL
ncbi:MAG: hypothetical protein OSB67_10220 [Alphaproteobacteria bacterium]|nr:hypothetical protein [Alphaproteobacteria bacterium]